MPDDRRALDDEIRRLAQGLAALEGRVAHLEQGEIAPTAPTESATPPPEDLIPSPAVVLAGLSRSIQYVGRLFLVLGGAYLLRSLTQGGGVPPGVGVGLGLAYGLLWIAVAARSASRGNVYAASWHGIAAAMITLPLIWETSARYELVPPIMSALMLGVSVLFALGVAWRYRLGVLAWPFVAGGGVCALALMAGNPGPGAPFAAALTIIAGVTLWAGRDRGWLGLVFVSALCVDLAMLLFVGRTLAADGPAPLHALFVPLLFFLVYTGSISVYVLRRWWRLDIIDVLQTVLALALGFSGALRIARESPGTAVPLGIATLVLAVGLYLLAFRVMDRERRRCFYYVTSMALVLVLVGSASLLESPALPWTLLAIATAAVGRLFGRVSLSLHATLYITAAVVASGLSAAALAGWVPAAITAASPPSPVGWFVLGALAVCAALPARGSISLGGGIRRVPHFFTLTALTWVVGGLLLDAVASSVTSDAWMATARTGAIAALALGAAAMAQVPHYRSARYLIYPLLAAGALKLLLEDLPAGVPASLSVSFLAYGSALILAHRLARHAGQGVARVPAEDPSSQA